MTTNMVKADDRPISNAMMEQRRAHTEAVLHKRAEFQLSDMTDEEFDRALDRLKMQQVRIERVIRDVLVAGKHYGNPNHAFKRDILFQGGAEELRRIWRLRVAQVSPPMVETRDEWCSATVHLAIFDQFGNQLADTLANCNTHEGRFYNDRSGKSAIKRDAREKYHDCVALAVKRASVRLTMEVTGATAYFADEDVMAEALAGGAEEVAAPGPWTPEQKRAFMLRARERAMPAGEYMQEWVRRQLDGERSLPTTDEVAGLMAALELWKPEPAPAPVAAAPVVKPDADLDKMPAALDEGDDDLPF